MRKIITALFISFFFGLQAQNIQLHYDLRHAVDPNSLSDFGSNLHERNYLTATLEWLVNDRLGSTYMFADFDFNGKNSNLGLMYTEINRKFNLGGNCPIQAMVEFNGGLGNGFTIPNSYLGGFSYSTMVNRFFFNTYVAYKLNNFHRASHDVQLTIVWSANFCRDKLTFSGFADLWTENRDRNRDSAGGGKKLVFLSEPQIWYNIVPKFAVGSEVELSYNFVKEAFKVYPTLAVKYTFR